MTWFTSYFDVPVISRTFRQVPSKLFPFDFTQTRNLREISTTFRKKTVHEFTHSAQHNSGDCAFLYIRSALLQSNFDLFRRTWQCLSEARPPNRCLLKFLRFC
jgi:hypothetical protein